MAFAGKVSDVAPGRLLVIDVEGEPVAVANVDGQLYAFSDTCTHRGCPLSDGELSGTVITCACHGGQFDVTNGKEVWSVRVGEVGNPNQMPLYPGARSTPTVEGDLIYALGSDGDLVCLETSGGKIRWQKNIRKEFDGVPGIWAYSESPLIDGDVLVCTPGGSDATMVALNKKTGDVIWKCAVPGADPARKVTWLELFFDLIFVAAVAQVGEPLRDDYTLSGLIRFSVLFVLIWWAWLGNAVFATRFDSDDVLQRALTLLQMFGDAAMAASTWYRPGRRSSSARRRAVVPAAMAASSQQARSCRSHGTYRPAASTRAPRRASRSSINASSPHVSGWSGISSVRSRLSRSPSAQRTVRTR